MKALLTAFISLSALNAFAATELQVTIPETLSVPAQLREAASLNTPTEAPCIGTVVAKANIGRGFHIDSIELDVSALDQCSYMDVMQANVLAARKHVQFDKPPGQLTNFPRSGKVTLRASEFGDRLDNLSLVFHSESRVHESRLTMRAEETLIRRADSTIIGALWRTQDEGFIALYDGGGRSNRSSLIRHPWFVLQRSKLSVGLNLNHVRGINGNETYVSREMAQSKDGSYYWARLDKDFHPEQFQYAYQYSGGRRILNDWDIQSYFEMETPTYMGQPTKEYDSEFGKNFFSKLPAR